MVQVTDELEPCQFLRLDVSAAFILINTFIIVTVQQKLDKLVTRI